MIIQFNSIAYVFMMMVDDNNIIGFLTDRKLLEMHAMF
jgi:hypothetical protein